MYAKFIDWLQRIAVAIFIIGLSGMVLVIYGMSRSNLKAGDELFVVFVTTAAVGLFAVIGVIVEYVIRSLLRMTAKRLAKHPPSNPTDDPKAVGNESKLP